MDTKHAEYGHFSVTGWLERRVEHDLAHLRQMTRHRVSYSASSRYQ